MNKLSALGATLVMFSLPFAAVQAAEEEESPQGKDGIDYAFVAVSFLESQSYPVEVLVQDGVEQRRGTQTERTDMMAASYALGTYITDIFKVEMRFGHGLTDDQPSSDMSVETTWWVSWYMGGQYDLTEYTNVYAQFGFSSVHGKAERTKVLITTPAPGDTEGSEINDDFDEDYFTQSFSASWLLGIDYKVMPATYLVLEAGELHRDTVLDMDTLQTNLGLRYEF